MDLSELYPIWRLLAAVLFGGIVGLERESRKKAAGLRTHMMVSLGAAAFTVATVALASADSTADPTRIIQGVATGIGFLGAGSILQKGDRIEGLTTAAGIWVVGGIGAACGLGAYWIAGATAAISAVVLGVVGRVEEKFGSNED